MGLQLPGPLASALGMIGIDWPEGDEEKLFKLGQAWLEFYGVMSKMSGEATDAAKSVYENHQGPTYEAFKKMWDEHGGTKNLNIAAAASMGFGLGIFVFAAITLVLKINAAVQLVILVVQIAQAIATAAPTFGASLLQIPIFRQITKTIVQNLIMMAIMKVVMG